MTPQKGVCITPASVTFRLPIIIYINECKKLFMYRNVVTEMSPDRNVSWPKRPRPKRLGPKRPRPNRPDRKACSGRN